MKLTKILCLLLLTFVYSCVGQAAIYADNSIEVVASEQPLAEGALSLERRDRTPLFTQWEKDDHREAFYAAQVIVKLWKDHNVASNHMIYGREDSTDYNKGTYEGTPTKPFAWEVVPFPDTEKPLWNQSKVWWKLTFGASELTSEEKKRLFNEYCNDYYAFQESTKYQPAKDDLIGTDAFCNPQVIEKQNIFDGKHVRLLYNYDPLGWGENKHHFLIVTKAHKEKFSDLSLEEYLEASEMAQKLISHYRIKGFPIAALCHRTGKLAGQTVPHWHLHVVFASSKADEFMQQLQVLGRSFFGHHPISNEELYQKVTKYQEELRPVLATETQ
jgi:diadenosine tetraphosphate (Ap4A) HIT family hydrolase